LRFKCDWKKVEYQSKVNSRKKLTKKTEYKIISIIDNFIAETDKPTKSNFMQLGTRIRQLREVKGFSQQVVADYLEMAQSNYHMIESDKTQPKLDILEKLASFYKISIADLISPDKNTVHIQNNNHNHNGVVIGDAELFQLCIKSKEDIIKAKDEMIVHLERELENERKKKAKGE